MMLSIGISVNRFINLYLKYCLKYIGIMIKIIYNNNNIIFFFFI